MRKTFLNSTLAMLFAVATSCGYDSTSPIYNPPVPSPSVGLWTSSGSPSEILRLDQAQLNGSGNRTASTAINTSSSTLFGLNSIAFDTDGTMWVASQDDSTLLGFAPAKLAASGSTDATTVIESTGGSLSGPMGLAFDRQHRLWVANFSNGTLVRFDRGQLAAGHTQIPAIVINGPGHPTGLAFDASGAMWISQSNKVVKYLPEQLETSGFLTPAVVLSTLGTTLVNPTGLAFDASGNLWVANSGSQGIAKFSSDQLAATGSPVPQIVLTPAAASVYVPEGLAFDSDGSLWVISVDGILDKFASSLLLATGTPEPSVRLILPDRRLFWSVAFWPKPAGLPLN
jgi:sugar lactone lactonase YvrE